MVVFLSRVLFVPTQGLYLGDKRSPFVLRQAYGKATPLLKKLVPINTLHEARLHAW